MSAIVSTGRIGSHAGDVAQALGGERTLAAFMRGQRPVWNAQWAWDHYRSTILELSRHYGLTRLCEIGGGRDPLFGPEEAERLGLSITVNDIDAHELSLCPDGVDKVRFNIAGDMSEPDVAPASQDLMFSRMVFEHVDGVARAWANIHTLLRPGGVALAFFPTLWNPVFALNHLLPEKASRAILHTLFPGRHDDGEDPKFPALYDWCRSSEARLRPMLGRAGFSDVHVQPFWGHGYLRRVPVARELDWAFNRFAALTDWRMMSTYAFVLVRKAG